MWFSKYGNVHTEPYAFSSTQQPLGGQGTVSGGSTAVNILSSLLLPVCVKHRSVCTMFTAACVDAGCFLCFQAYMDET